MAQRGGVSEKRDRKWIQIIFGKRACIRGKTRLLRDLVCLIFLLTSDWKGPLCQKKIQ